VSENNKVEQCIQSQELEYTIFNKKLEHTVHSLLYNIFTFCPNLIREPPTIFLLT